MTTEANISLGAGFAAEARGEKEYAIHHPNGGLHMAGLVEVAMIESISRLQAQVDALAECLNGALDYASQKMATSPAGRCLLNKSRAALAAAGR